MILGVNVFYYPRSMIVLFPYMARWNSANTSRYYHLFNKIADAGRTVIVVQPPPKVSEETNYIDLPMKEHPNIKIHTVKIQKGLWNCHFPLEKFIKKTFYTVFSFFFIKKMVNEYRPDVLVIYNLPQFIYTYIDIPIVFDYADGYISMMSHELGVRQSNVLCKLGQFLLDQIIKKSSLVTSVSSLLNDKINHSNKFLLPNGADITKEMDDKTTLHIDKNKPVIGYVGAFEYFIDLELMLNAAAAMPQYVFLLVGAGRDYSWVKDEVLNKKLNNVILTGAVPHKQAMQFIREMDICLNLFKKSNVSHAASPIKLFEYLAKERPVITTRLNEVERLDPDSRIFYYADTLNELTASVEMILNNSVLATEKVRRGIELINSGFNWDNIGKIFVHQIEMLEHKSSSAL